VTALAIASLRGLLKGLGKHWPLVVIAMLAAALAMQGGTLKRVTGERDRARAALVNPATKRAWQFEAERDARALTTCQGSVTRLEGSVRTQNDAVEAAKAEGARRAAAAVQAARDLRGARAVAESRSRDVMDATVDGATCEAREAQLLELAGASLP
jgi:hypothetical protein